MEKPSLKSVKDPAVLKYIEYLEQTTDILLNNSRAKTFIVLRRQVDSWNEQLIIRDEERPDPDDPSKTVTVKAGYIDLFADKDSKEFDRVWKYLDGADDLEDKLAKMHEKLKPDEKEQVAKIREGSSAERNIFNKK
jgi:hypothetical protein